MKIKAFKKIAVLGIAVYGKDAVMNATVTDENDKVWGVTVKSIVKDDTSEVTHFEIPETGQTGMVKYEWVMTESMVVNPLANKEQ